MTGEGEDRNKASYRDNYERLAAIKNTYIQRISFVSIKTSGPLSKGEMFFLICFPEIVTPKVTISRKEVKL
jgi:hypothetical protein